MQKRSNYFLDNEDLQFHFDHRLDFAVMFELASRDDLESMGIKSADEYRSTWRELAAQVGEVAGGIIAKNALRVTQEDLVLKDGDVKFPGAIRESVDSLKAVGIASLGIASKFGGLPSPIALEMAVVEVIYRACPSTVLNITWFSPIARVLDEYGSDDQKARIIPRIASGEWSGNMALTEPDAGSDLGAIRTYGEKQADGSYRLFGSKRFISNGCGMVSLVLAKREKGVKGLATLNLYLCLHKKEDGSSNYEVTKIEEKTGLHGSPTCELKYDGSYAELIGEEGKGFEYMLHLMNEARVGVSFQGLGIMEAVLRLAKDYTSQRHTWGRPIAHHEMILEKLLDLEVSTAGLRSLLVQCSNALSISLLASQRLRDDKDLTLEQTERFQELKQKYTRRLRSWTPLVKFYAGEKAVFNARECVQMHGGYGFTCEYLAEWWLRESLIIPVYEGTSQIQALMCLKDSLKEITRKPTRFIESALGTRVKVIAERDPLMRKLNKLRQEYDGALMAIIFKLVKVNVRTSLSDVNPSHVREVLKILTKELVKFETLRPALLHAERITEIKCMMSIGESLVKDVKADPSRLWIAERWINKSLPRAAMLRSEIQIDEPVLQKRLALIPSTPLI
jgi:alkylation response protein AidB-like acyl-CoA dehydrogenase